MVWMTCKQEAGNGAAQPALCNRTNPFEQIGYIYPFLITYPFEQCCHVNTEIDAGMWVERDTRNRRVLGQYPIGQQSVRLGRPIPVVPTQRANSALHSRSQSHGSNTDNLIHIIGPRKRNVAGSNPKVYP